MKKAVFSLGAIMAFRMLGLFMILPVFAVAARHYTGSTALLIGVALGIYGLTQACLQIPFGFLSDKIGRKPIILIGLVCFLLGSLLAGYSTSIYGVIAGRALQGAGAVGSTILAFVADLTPDEGRTKAMATIGMLIGLSFMIAIIVGPLLNTAFHLNGIFYFTALLALLGIVMLFTLPNTKPIVDDNVEAAPDKFKSVLKNKDLLRMDSSILLQHATLTSLFMAVPVLLNKILHLSQNGQMLMYLIVFILAFIFMLPMIIIGEKKRKLRSVFLISVFLLFASQVLLIFFHHGLFVISLLLFIFFTAFTALESSLPSLVSKISPLDKKGTAMGVYSTSQFFGIFMGGVLSGLVFSHFHITGVFALGAAFCFIWLCFILKMPEPPYLSTKVFTLADPQPGLKQQVLALAGVHEAVVSGQILYLKIDKQQFNSGELQPLLETGNLSANGEI